MDFFIRLANFVGRIVTSLWFWIAVLVAALAWLLISLYRQAKLRALDQVAYSRHFSTDGIFVGETLELIETIRNPSWFPLFRVRVEFFVPGGLTVDEIECKKHTKVTSIFYIPPTPAAIGTTLRKKLNNVCKRYLNSKKIHFIK